jgi:glycosyltransferase involved in cell wall biosynthesis
MKILFVADGRSPIVLNWMRYFVERGDQVHLVSTFHCQPGLALAGLEFVPVAFSAAKSGNGPTAASRSGVWSARALGLRTAIRQWLGPLTIYRAAQRLREIIRRLSPDLIHAMRIPYEGMLAADAVSGIPLVLSIWGNDFTLHAPSTPLMRHYTAWALQAADALHADCQRDIRLAREWGFDSAKPTLVSPGNGGIRGDVFSAPRPLPAQPVVVNPRGFRAYVRNDTFFKSIPLVLAQKPEARFRCASMAGDTQALAWVQQLGLAGHVELLEQMPHEQMAGVFRAAQVVVSPSIHDGTPNTLLEAMACGCLPVAGDLESIREWITPEENGLLIDPADPAALAGAILRGLNDAALRERAATRNAALIAERGEYKQNMKRAEAFYDVVVRRS